MARLRGTQLPRTVGNSTEVEAWASGLVSKWQSKLASLGVEGSGSLVRSFRFTAEWESRMVSNSEVEFLRRVQFAFNFWGKMLDYGLGRGTDIKDRFEGGRDPDSNPRKRKRWITEPFAAERKTISKLITTSTASYSKALLRHHFESALTSDFITKQN